LLKEPEIELSAALAILMIIVACSFCLLFGGCTVTTNSNYRIPAENALLDQVTRNYIIDENDCSNGNGRYLEAAMRENPGVRMGRFKMKDGGYHVAVWVPSGVWIDATPGGKGRLYDNAAAIGEFIEWVHPAYLAANPEDYQ
jgi:hypothetical protein